MIRPKISDFVGNESSRKKIVEWLVKWSNGSKPLLLVGPPGVGKTSFVHAMCREFDIDLIELNEAFASQSLAVIRELQLNPEIVNINGGAIALGHPLGCTGCKLTVQILHDLKRLNKKYGLVTACVGGGQGIAGIIENIS